MAITTIEDYKLFYAITATTYDVQIADLIPVVEEDYLKLRNIPFETDSNDDIVYPAGSGTVANMMINYLISTLSDNGQAISSEKIGSYSVSYSGSGGNLSYPPTIKSLIKQYLCMV